MDSVHSPESAPIAIIGVACRFPGGAGSAEELWDLLANGRSAYRTFPPDRLNIDGFYHPSPERSDSFNFKGAHFIDGDIAAFDAKFFGIAAAEANAIDPQQRLLLEVAYEAVENAGLPMEHFKGTRTSVFVGSFVKDYEQISMRDSQTTAPDCATGNGIAIMANRISYFFDLSGTSQTIDTGCSASLVCVHQAVNNLRSGQSDMAIAGGAGLILTPSTIMPMTSLGFLSADGKCFTFDSRANGYGRGEGVGIVVLKRLQDAIRDNDTIRAVIRGTASNQDGRTPGITVPNPDAQVRCIRAAYADAGLDSRDTAYVECHGTGTKVGDWRELKAVSESLCGQRSEEQPILVGSIKPNIGHLEGSAGVAGLIKAILIAEKGQIPPHINFKQWNPDIKHKEWKVDVAQSLMPFPSRELRRISVNCFGFGGTNAHGVLDDARAFLRARVLTAHHNTAEPWCEQLSDAGSVSDAVPEPLTPTTLGTGEPLSPAPFVDPMQVAFPAPHLFVFSARHRDGVSNIVSSHMPYLELHASNPGLLRDYSYTMYSRRSHLDYRAFVVAQSPQELAQAMAKTDAAKVVRADGASHELKPAWIFGGQGAQWPRMGMELMAFEPFYHSIQAAGTFMRALDSGFHLADALYNSTDATSIHLPEVAQPATTALQVALVDLMRACQIKPVAVVGHSSGEISAAYAAGFITREDAWRLAFHRGQCAKALKQRDPDLRGRMLAVALSRSAAEEYIGRVRPGAVVVSCINSPQLVTLSGDEDAILAVKAGLDDQDIFNSLVAVEIAYHSHHMIAVSQQYLDSISGIVPQPGIHGITMYSSVHGGEVSGAELVPSYWSTNLVNPVEFEKAVSSMMGSAARGRPAPNLFIEVSPHRVWPKALQQILDATGFRNRPVPYSPMVERGKDAVRTMLHVIGELFLHGVRVNLDWVFKSHNAGVQPKCLVDLPPYPWDHSKTYWHESHASRAHRFRQFGRRDLIGAPTADSVLPYEPRWRGFFRVSENPWILDHKVQKEVLYPAAGMVAMAIEAARQVVHEVVDQPSDILDFEVSQFEIKAPMVVPTDDRGLEHCMNAKRVKEVFLGASLGGITTWAYEFTIFSRPYEESPFQENAKGLFTVRFCAGGAGRNGRAGLLTKPVPHQARSAGPSPFEFYEGLDVIGMGYGPSFRNIVSIGSVRQTGTGRECQATIAIPDTKTKMPKQFEFDHTIHPASLDAVFQTIFTLGDQAMVPFYIDSIRIAADIPAEAGAKLEAVALGKSVGLRQASACVDVWHIPHSELGIGTEGRHVLEVSGLRAMSIAGTAAGSTGFLPSNRNLASQVVWKEDIRYASLENERTWFDLLGHKMPDAAILHVGENAGIVKMVFQALVEGSPSEDASTAPRLANYTIHTKTDAAFNAAIQLINQKDRSLVAYEPRLDLLRTGSSRQMFDLVIVELTDDSWVNDEFETLVKPSGNLLVVSSAPLPSWLPSVQSTLAPMGSIVSVPEVGCLQLFNNPAVSDSESRYSQDVVILAPNLSPVAVTPLATHLQQVCSGAGLTSSIRDLGWLEGLSQEDGNVLVISLLDVSDLGGLLFDMGERTYGLIKKLLQTVKGLFWITRGAQRNCENPRNAPFLGWARTVRSEDPHRHIVCLDLHSENRLDANTAVLVHRVLVDSFLSPTHSALRETEFAEEGGRVFIPRLLPLNRLNSLVEHGRDHAHNFGRGTLGPGPSRSAAAQQLSTWGRELKIGEPGNLDSFFFHYNCEVGLPVREDEVRIMITQTFLLPGDVDTALGRSTETAIGTDVLGYVIAVGKNVARFRVHDAVVALARGTVKESIALRESSVLAWDKFRELIPTDTDTKPALRWSPTALAIAYRSIKGMQIDNTTTVLVHAAAGMLGTAVVLLLRRFSARVIAVVFNDEEKDLVRDSFGMDERFIVYEGPDVAKNVQQLAGELSEEGDDKVCLIFDPTPSGHLDTNFSCVANYGRVFHIVSNSEDCDHVRLPRRPFEYVRFDLHERLAWGSSLARDFNEFRTAMNLGGPKGPMPLSSRRVFSFGRVGDALKQLQKHPFQGTYVLEVDPQEHVRQSKRQSMRSMHIHPDGTYIVIGGLGGLGLSIAEWLIRHGSQHVVLVSRSGATDTADQARGDAFAQRYRALARSNYVETCALDICDGQKVTEFVDCLKRKNRKIRGVVHAAGVVRDRTYRNMEYEDWLCATRPKTIGSWNLHNALPKDMDFLVFLSSAAGVIGNRGQANYAAGNAFQDALARHRSAHGMHTVSLDLGPIIGAGMVDQGMMDHLKSVGFFGIRLQDMLSMLERAIVGCGLGSDDPIPPQIVMGVGTGGLVAQNKPADPFWAQTALFAHLNHVDVDPRAASSGSSSVNDGVSDGDGAAKTIGGLSLLDLRPRLRMAGSEDEAREMVMGPLVAAMVSIIPNLEASDVKPAMTPAECQSDSMRGTNIDNWLKRTTGVSIGPSINSMTMQRICEEVVRKTGYFGPDSM